MSFRPHPDENKFHWLRDVGIRTILDIGANVGQFATQVRRSFPDATIYSFEPLKDVFETIKVRRRDSGDHRWHVFNTAIGADNGRSTIHRWSKNTTDSSMLPMSPYYLDAYHRPNAEVWQEEIAVAKLDDVVSGLHMVPELMIKMDTEGAESAVISGGRNTFRNAKVVFTEVTFHKERYSGQILFDEIYGWMRDMGFECHGFYHMAYEQESGAPFYGDAVFIRR